MHTYHSLTCSKGKFLPLRPPPFSWIITVKAGLDENNLKASQRAVFLGSQHSQKRQSPPRRGFQDKSNIRALTYALQEPLLTRGHLCLMPKLKWHESLWSSISKQFHGDKFPSTPDVREPSDENQFTYSCKTVSVLWTFFKLSFQNTLFY